MFLRRNLISSIRVEVWIHLMRSHDDSHRQFRPSETKLNKKPDSVFLTLNMVQLSFRLVQYWFICYVHYATYCHYHCCTFNQSLVFPVLILFALLLFISYLHIVLSYVHTHINRYIHTPYLCCPYFNSVLSVLIIVLSLFPFLIYILFTNNVFAFL